MNTLSRLNSPQLHLVIASRPAVSALMNALIARLALAGAVQVLDAGNLFDVYRIARLAQRQSPHLATCLNNIHVARAFTYYQVAAQIEPITASGVPIMVLDLPATFCDETAPLGERLRLLERCLDRLYQTSRSVPVVVSAALHKAKDTEPLMSKLQGCADHIWRFEATAPPAPAQLRLL